MTRRAAELVGAGRAKKLLRDRGIRTAADIDVELIAASCGCYTTYRDVSGAQGHLLRSAKHGLIVVGNESLRTKQWRFVIAHELGHYLLHQGVDQFELCTRADLHRWYGASGTEQQANAFAAELLMPTHLFGPECDCEAPDLHHVRLLADEFETTVSAASLRFVALCPEPCAVAFSGNDGMVGWWGRGEGFPFTLRKGYRLTTATYAGDIHAGESAPDRPEPLDAVAWSDDERAIGIEVCEHSIRLGRYGVLSLLWAMDASDGDDAPNAEDIEDVPRFR